MVSQPGYPQGRVVPYDQADIGLQGECNASRQRRIAACTDDAPPVGGRIRNDVLCLAGVLPWLTESILTGSAAVITIPGFCRCVCATS